MSDFIRREDAINAMMVLKRADDLAYGCEIPESFDSERAIEALKNISSAEPERKKGEWIEQDDGWDGTYYQCSCCREEFSLIDGTPADNLYNFCPNCGAEMTRGEE